MSHARHTSRAEQSHPRAKDGRSTDAASLFPTVQPPINLRIKLRRSRPLAGGTAHPTPLFDVTVGSEKFGPLTQDDLTELDLHDGGLWCEPLRPKLQHVLALRQCSRKATDLLARRSRSSHELRTRLLTAGFANDSVDTAIARLVKLGLLDDRAAAAETIRAAARHGDARPVVDLKLRSRGLQPDSVVDGSIPDSDDLDAATATARKLLDRTSKLTTGTPTPHLWIRTHGALLRRGFDEETARAALLATLGQFPESPETGEHVREP